MIYHGDTSTSYNLTQLSILNGLQYLILQIYSLLFWIGRPPLEPLLHDTPCHPSEPSIHLKHSIIPETLAQHTIPESSIQHTIPEGSIQHNMASSSKTSLSKRDSSSEGKIPFLRRFSQSDGKVPFLRRFGSSEDLTDKRVVSNKWGEGKVSFLRRFSGSEGSVDKGQRVSDRWSEGKIPFLRRFSSSEGLTDKRVVSNKWGEEKVSFLKEGGVEKKKVFLRRLSHSEVNEKKYPFLRRLDPVSKKESGYKVSPPDTKLSFLNKITRKK